MNANILTIGHLARETGTKVETVRFYEKSGLLPQPTRTEGNYRSYDRAHLNSLSFIRRARDLGFSLDQIRALLALSDDRERSCAAVDEIAKEHRERGPAEDRRPPVAEEGTRPDDRAVRLRHGRRLPDHRIALSLGEMILPAINWLPHRRSIGFG